MANARAGAADPGALDAAVGVLREGASVDVATCDDPAELDAVLDRRGGRALVVAGGDGSLHLLVRALHRRGELRADDPVGLLPLGTGNDLARTVGIPLEPPAAAAAVLRGRARRVDLLVDEDGEVVLNAVHAGLGAEAARRAGGLKDLLGAAAYPLGSVVAGVLVRGWRLRVRVDGRVVYGGVEPVLMVGVGNGRTVGGGAPLTPDAEPDDGLADVVVSLATGPVQRAAYAAALRVGEHVERPDVLSRRGRLVEVSGEEFPVNADGELAGPYTARTWRVLPARWSLMAPAG